MRLTWDGIGEKLYETGLDRGVHYLPDATGAYTSGVPWNGLTSITERPTGAEANAHYADNIKYANIVSAEDYEATIEAFTYPDQFAQCDGSATVIKGMRIGQQPRPPFGLCYRTLIGNDVDGQNHGYKLHMLYGCQVSPSDKNRETINESPEPVGFSWELTTTPVPVTGFQPTATVEIDSTLFDEERIKALEDVLYGTEAEEARLPMPDEIAQILNGTSATAVARMAKASATKITSR